MFNEDNVDTNELWKPKTNEWCFFANDLTFTPILCKFVGELESGLFLVEFHNGKGEIKLKEFKFCFQFDKIKLD